MWPIARVKLTGTVHKEVAPVSETSKLHEQVAQPSYTGACWSKLREEDAREVAVKAARPSCIRDCLSNRRWRFSAVFG